MPPWYVIQRKQVTGGHKMSGVCPSTSVRQQRVLFPKIMVFSPYLGGGKIFPDRESNAYA